MSHLIQLPLDMQYEIMKTLKGQDLLHYCSVIKHPICFQESFWQQQTNRDFNYQEKPYDLTWQEFYVELSNNMIKSICVDILIYSNFNTYYLKTRRLPLLFIRKDETFNDILDSLYEWWYYQLEVTFTPETIYFNDIFGPLFVVKYPFTYERVLGVSYLSKGSMERVSYSFLQKYPHYQKLTYTPELSEYILNEPIEPIWNYFASIRIDFSLTVPEAELFKSELL